jgi:uncharacterized membrane protein
MSTPLLVIITILGWGVGAVFYKLANNNIHPVMVDVVSTIAAIGVLPFLFLLTDFPKDLNLPGIVYSSLGGLLMGIGGLAYFFALRRSEAGEITTITALYPAVTLVASILFLHEGMSLKKSLGIGLALVSFFILSQK